MKEASGPTTFFHELYRNKQRNCIFAILQKTAYGIHQFIHIVVYKKAHSSD
jgi:hypothetical protein